MSTMRPIGSINALSSLGFEELCVPPVLGWIGGVFSRDILIYSLSVGVCEALVYGVQCL